MRERTRRIVAAVALTVAISLLPACTGAQVQDWFARRGQTIDWPTGHAIAVQLNTHFALLAYLQAVEASSYGNRPPLPAIRACESGGNYRAVNPSGSFRGAYQFDRQTWNGVASRHRSRLVGVDPAAASPPDQDYLAWMLYTERGRAPWPNC